MEESEEQVERLRFRVRTISSRKNSPERGNSPDLYNPNINLEMATVTELADAIDNFVSNQTTDRTILAGQVLRCTRSIRRKFNDLQAECNTERIQKQNAERVEQRVIADLHQLQTMAKIRLTEC